MANDVDTAEVLSASTTGALVQLPAVGVEFPLEELYLCVRLADRPDSDFSDVYTKVEMADGEFTASVPVSRTVPRD